MKESQIDWVDEVLAKAIPRLSIFDIKQGYEEATLLVNALRTPDGTILESRHQHDYKEHEDAKSKLHYFVDGGLAYSRGNYSQDGAVDLRVYDKDDIRLIREYFSWGSYSKCGTKPLEYILLKNMSDEHISNILKTQTHISTSMFDMFVRELEYRESNDIYVEDTYG